jgi:hypothetical protein
VEEPVDTECDKEEFTGEGIEEEPVDTDGDKEEFTGEGFEEEPVDTDGDKEEFTGEGIEEDFTGENLEIEIPGTEEMEDGPEEDVFNEDEFDDMSDEYPDDLFTEAVQLRDNDTEESLFGEETSEDLQFPEEDTLNDELSLEGEAALEEPLNKEEVKENMPEESLYEEEIPEETAPTEISPEKEDNTRLSKSDVISLLNYFKYLAEALPEKNRDSFLQSNILLKIAYITDYLKGNTGIYTEIEKRLPQKEEVIEEKPAGIVDTLKYLETLIGSLPNKELSPYITRMTEKVISDIKDIKKERFF